MELVDPLLQFVALREEAAIARRKLVDQVGGAPPERVGVDPVPGSASSTMKSWRTASTWRPATSIRAGMPECRRCGRTVGRHARRPTIEGGSSPRPRRGCARRRSRKRNTAIGDRSFPAPRRRAAHRRAGSRCSPRPASRPFARRRGRRRTGTDPWQKRRDGEATSRGAAPANSRRAIVGDPALM